MNKDLIKKLKEWRSKKGREENLELYLILQNKIIDAIAEALPTNKVEFIAIKGLRDRKFQKYGKDILSIVAEYTGQAFENEEPVNKEKIYSVSDFLELINSTLGKFHVKVKGEISSFSIRDKYLFFTIKDLEQESVVSCFMCKKDYKISDIDIKEGMEIIVFGTPEVYQRTGRFNIRTETIELVGEGALKKKYEVLKKKLESEGLFEAERKKPIPAFSSRIGLITSKSGAVINDFLNNLGRFGYKISLFDSRVEGMMAVKDLISAIRYFRDKSIDVLVIIRGGGSLESLQAFNNEALIREMINFPMPIMCGIGHDKDVPLFSLVADKAESTPTAVAREINRSWEEAIAKINQHEADILSQFQMILNNKDHLIEQSFLKIKHYYQKMIKIFESFEQIVERIFNSFTYVLKYNKERIDNFVKSLEQNNPERQLKLGYSIMFSGGKVIKSINQVKKEDMLKSKLKDGEILSIIDKINKEE